MTSEQRAYFAEDEDGDVHAFVGSVGDALVASGVIFRRDDKWHIRKRDVDIVFAKRRDLAVCDFCTERPVVFDVDVADFEDRWGNHSVAGWAACAACGVLIQRGDRVGLLQRVVEAHRPLVPLLKMLREQQRLFWKHFRSITAIPPKPFGH